MDDQEFRTECQEIANAMTLQLPENWHTAWVEVTFGEGSALTQAHWKPAESDSALSLVADWRMLEPIVAIREITCKSMKVRWGHARFTMSVDGSFNLEIDY